MSIQERFDPISSFVLEQKAKLAESKDRPNSSTPCNASTTSTLTKIAESLGKGWISYASSLMTTVMIAGMICDNFGCLPLNSSRTKKVIIGGPPILYGIISAIGNFKSKAIVQPPSHIQKSTLSKIAEAAYSGLHACAATAGTIGTAYEVILGCGYQLPTGALHFFLGASAFAGCGHFLKACDSNFQLKSNIRWNNMSKTKKAGVLSASMIGMLGLATLCIGPTAMGNGINGMRALTMKDLYGAVQKQFTNLAYTTTSEMINEGTTTLSEMINAGDMIISGVVDLGETIKSENIVYKNVSETINTVCTIKSNTTTAKISEWIASYTDNENAERLIQLGQEEDISCAEILETCHLNPSDIGHRKKYQELSKKFHPDRAKIDKDLARKAFEILSKVQGNVQLGLVNCAGQDEVGCLMKAQDLTIRKKLMTCKEFNLEPECYFYKEDGSREKAIHTSACDSLKVCKDQSDIFTKDSQCNEVVVSIKARKELTIPESLHAKLMNVESECYIYPEEMDRKKLSLDACSNLKDQSGFKKMIFRIELIVPDLISANYMNAESACYLIPEGGVRKKVSLEECSGLINNSDPGNFVKKTTLTKELIDPDLTLVKHMVSVPECHLYPGGKRPKIKISSDHCSDLVNNKVQGTFVKKEKIVKELITPYPLYARIMNIEPECFVYPEGKGRKKASLDDCSELNIQIHREFDRKFSWNKNEPLFSPEKQYPSSYYSDIIYLKGENRTWFPLNWCSILMDCNDKGTFRNFLSDKNITIRKELIAPNWWYAKFRNVEPECYLYPEGGDRIKVELDICSNLK